MGQGWDRDGTGTGQGRNRDGTGTGQGRDRDVTGTGQGRWDGTGRGARQKYSEPELAKIFQNHQTVKTAI